MMPYLYKNQPKDEEKKLASQTKQYLEDQPYQQEASIKVRPESQKIMQIKQNKKQDKKEDQHNYSINSHDLEEDER